MKHVDFNSMVKGIFPIVISGVFLLFFPLFAQGVDVPILPTQYCLMTSATPVEGGTISPAGTTCYEAGQIVHVSATANTEYLFINWSGDITGFNNPDSITMDGNKNVEAEFTPIAGTLDTTFNSPNGFITHSGAIGYAIALQPDGKIVVVGEKSGSLLVLRYTNGGALDSTFGNNGVVAYDAASGAKVAIQPDGKIVVVGSSSSKLLILRYNTDGTLDPTFGVNGIASYGTLSDVGGYALVLQTDGKIIVGGNISSDLLVLRYGSEGTLDTTFGVNGVFIFANASGHGVALQGDGKIVVVGGTNGVLLLLRLSDGGMFDNDFGVNGVVTYAPSITTFTGGSGLAVQKDGKIIVVGTGSIAGEVPGFGPSALIGSYTSDGVLDTTFGNNGIITLGGGPNELGAYYNDVALQEDGKIVAVGIFGIGSFGYKTSFLVSRYNNDGSTDNTFKQVIGALVTPQPPHEEGKSVIIQSDGKIIIVDNDNLGANILVVRFIVKEEQLEAVSIPSPPSGPTTGNILQSYTFSVGGSLSNQGHPIEYRVDWDDGTYSNWSSTGTFFKNWNSPGNYKVRAQARCTLHQEIQSVFSEPLIINISAVELVSTPNILYGPTNGIPDNSYSYTTGGSSSNFQHPIQYLFDWGDGTNSGWLPVGTTSVSHSWTTSGTYLVKVQARCATDTNVTSSWSGSLSVTIGPIPLSYTVTTNPSGLQIIIDGTSYTGLQTFNWTPGSSHILSISSPQSGTAGTRYVFSSWSDGGVQTHTVTAPSSSTTYTATFSTQFQLTITSSPPAGGTVAPSPMGDQSGIVCPALAGVICPGYYSSGTMVTLTASPNTGYTFNNWSGDANGLTNPVTATISGNKNVTANFTELIGPDLTGEWTTPVTQACKNTKKGPKCTITGTLTINNNGNRDASSSTVKFYLSNSNTYDAGDTPLKSAVTGKIKAKQSKPINLTKSFPLDQDVKGMYIIAVIDKYNSVKEVDETNNVIVFGPIQ